MTEEDRKLRLLIVDDNPHIHEDYKRILIPPKSPSNAARNIIQKNFFGADHESESPERLNLNLEVDSAFSGQEGIDKIKRAIEEEWAYFMAYVDMRMPPGLNGLETTIELLNLDPQLEVVICTAHSDYDVYDLAREIGQAVKGADRYLVLRKPFEASEIFQMVNSLKQKWILRHQMQETLQKLHRKTEDLNEALKAKKIFLSNMGHELRTPVHIIQSFAKLGVVKSKETHQEASEREKADQQNKKYFELIHRNSERFIDLLDDALMLNDLDTEKLKLNLEIVDVAKMAKGCFDDLTPLALQKDLKFEIKISQGIDSTLALADPDRLSNVFYHLLDNAIKFSHPSQTIAVEFVKEKEVDGQEDFLHIKVINVGVGIDKGDFEKIFGPFYIGKKTKSQSGGRGLGLAIVQKIIKLHKGDIWVNEAAEGVTEFYMILWKGNRGQ